MATMAQLSPFLRRYGLTATEMAILTTHGHALKGAKNSGIFSGIFPFTYANFNSGIDYVWKNIRDKWQFFGDWMGSVTSSPGGNPFEKGNIGRFPSDLMFYPTVVKSQGLGTADNAFLSVEKTMRGFIGRPACEFDERFGIIFAKMLRIGSGKLQKYSEAQSLCPSRAYPKLKSF